MEEPFHVEIRVVEMEEPSNLETRLVEMEEPVNLEAQEARLQRTLSGLVAQTRRHLLRSEDMFYAATRNLKTRLVAMLEPFKQHMKIIEA